MVSRRNRTLVSLAIFVGVLAWNVAAAAVKGETGVSVEDLTTHQIEEQLQVGCSSANCLAAASLYLLRVYGCSELSQAATNRSCRVLIAVLTRTRNVLLCKLLINTR